MKSKIFLIMKIFISSLVGLIVLFFSTFFLSLSYDRYVNENKVPMAFNIGIVCVNENSISMLDTFDGNDLLIIKNQERYQKDDIITFLEDLGSNQVRVVTHRISKVIEEDGKLTYITKGDNNLYYDVNEKIQIYGKVVKIYDNGANIVSWLILDNGWMYILSFIFIIILAINVILKR